MQRRLQLASSDDADADADADTDARRDSDHARIIGRVAPRHHGSSGLARLTFVNNDSTPHDMSSDPHPEHTGCPEITVGFVPTG